MKKVTISAEMFRGVIWPVVAFGNAEGGIAELRTGVRVLNKLEEPAEKIQTSESLEWRLPSDCLAHEFEFEDEEAEFLAKTIEASVSKLPMFQAAELLPILDDLQG